MTSTGNDIVALKAINIARTKQPQFYSKILSASEKELYDLQFDGKIAFENFVWLAWSVKESAYKFLQRITPELVFSPTRVNITQVEMPVSFGINFNEQIEGCGFDDETIYKGVVIFEDHTLYFRSIITDDFICSVVNNVNDFKNTCWGIQMITSAEQAEQSKAVRIFLDDRLQKLFPEDSLQIGKSPHGYPVLLKDGSGIAIPVSLAHHGCFVAYSFQININP